ncbi:glycosyltransferase family 4 protein, partial [bacterium]|nr:glycosyltransferase family 4 protein [bacterium]
PVFGQKGASIHLREMVTALCSAGHSVSVISPAIDKEKSDVWKGLANGCRGSVDILSLPAAERHLRLNGEIAELETFVGKKSRIRQELRNILYNRTLGSSALDRLRTQHVDFVYERYSLFGYAGIQIARELNVPHLLEVNAPLAYEQEKMRGLEMKTLARDSERTIFCQTDRLLAVSRPLYDYAKSCGVLPKSLRIMPNGVDPRHFTPNNGDGGRAVRARYQLEGKTVIGFVGTLKPWHGVESLLQAFQLVNSERTHTHLLIVGEGPARKELEQYTREHGMSKAVTFAGEVTHDEIPGYISAMEITVAPYVPNDNFYFSPIKIFEYMAMDKPVIAGKLGQIEEIIVPGKTGILFEPGNRDQLKKALEKLVDDSQLRQSLGENARKWVVENRTWRSTAKQVVDIACEILEKRTKGSNRVKVKAT